LSPPTWGGEVYGGCFDIHFAVEVRDLVLENIEGGHYQNFFVSAFLSAFGSYV
jgi:hypothetical protein